MYQIQIRVSQNSKTETSTHVFDCFDLNYCRKQLKVIKDRYSSIGAIIHELKIYQVEQIQDAEQI